MSSLIRIYCDANLRIDERRFDLGCVGSMRDIERNANVIKTAQRVLFYASGEWEAEGTIHFDEKRKRWFGVPDFTTLHYRTGEC